MQVIIHAVGQERAIRTIWILAIVWVANNEHIWILLLPHFLRNMLEKLNLIGKMRDYRRISGESFQNSSSTNLHPSSS